MENKKLGEYIGFLFMFFISAAILYWVFRLTGKLPEGWIYFHFLTVILVIVIIGGCLKKFLK